MSDLVVAHNCCMARMLPGEAENGVGMNRSVREGKSVKRFERSNGLDTALFKNYLFFLPFLSPNHDCSALMKWSNSNQFASCSHSVNI